MNIHSDLESIKKDLPALLRDLGIQGDHARNHAPCPFCGSKDALSVQHGESAAYFACHSCGTKGDRVSAIAKLENITAAEAIKRLTGSTWTPTAPRPSPRTEPQPPSPPTIDRDKANAIMLPAFENIFEQAARPWLEKRRISRQCAEQHPHFGFIHRADIPGWKSLLNAWVFRIADADGDLRALKIHRENPLDGIPKSSWLPFGTQPPAHPRHGWGTLYPAPEWFDPSKPLMVCEGELKALRCISAGLAATSPTTGSSFVFQPWTIARLKGRHVVIIYDADPPGIAFRDRTIDSLDGHVLSLATTPVKKVEVAA